LRFNHKAWKAAWGG